MTYGILDQRATGLPAKIGIVIAGTALLTLAAKVQVPFWPVPMTPQTLAVPTGVLARRTAR